MLLGVVAVATIRSPADATRSSAAGALHARRPRPSPVTSRVRSASRSRSSARLGAGDDTPADAIVVCSFGDASINHSTAAGRINTACHTASSACDARPLRLRGQRARHQRGHTAGLDRGAYGHRPAPALLRCGRASWSRSGRRPRPRMLRARRRRPAFLHLKMVRLMGHAGWDVEHAYRPLAEIAPRRPDPLHRTRPTPGRERRRHTRELRERDEETREGRGAEPRRRPSTAGS